MIQFKYLKKINSSQKEKFYNLNQKKILAAYKEKDTKDIYFDHFFTDGFGIYFFTMFETNKITNLSFTGKIKQTSMNEFLNYVFEIFEEIVTFVEVGSSAHKLCKRFGFKQTEQDQKVVTMRWVKNLNFQR